MALPPPPGASNTPATPAPAAAPQPVAQPAAAPAAPAAPAATAAPAAVAPAESEKKERKPIASFGPARGENAVPVPTVFGEVSVDLNATFEAIMAAASANVGDITAFCNAAEGVPKGAYPGNKEGRAAWATVGIVQKILRTHEAATKVRESGGGKVAKLEAQLAAVMAALSPEQRAQLGLG